MEIITTLLNFASITLNVIALILVACIIYWIRTDNLKNYKFVATNGWLLVGFFLIIEILKGVLK